jgi:hypothetical protein
MLLAAAPIPALAQRADPRDPKNAELGAELLRKAVAARGGDRYLGFKAILTTGQFTSFDKGMSTVPRQFSDWIVYPDRERTEFGKGKKKDRLIQVNVGKGGWVYDGDAQTLKDQSEQQIKAHLEGIEFDIDRILRVSWKEPGAEVRFWGREEIRPGERANVVEIKLKGGQEVYLWLDRGTNLPISLIYEKTEEGALVKRETRYFQYVDYEGVKFPNIVDFIRDGVQEGRVNLQSVKLDPPITESLWTKPASIKEIK